MFANVSLAWNEPEGRVDNYSIRVSIVGQSLVNFSVTTSNLTLEKIPYNEDITVSISAVNCVAESDKVNISFFISKYLFSTCICIQNLKSNLS